MVLFVATIVEGHGEVEALPRLLYRIAEGELSPVELRVNTPIRVKAGSFVNDREYRRRQVTLATEKAAQRGGVVIVLLDCEDDCPAELGPRLLGGAQEIRDDVPILVVLAYREYESWFLSAARSLRGLRGLPTNLEPPENAEAIRDAKGWLGARMNEAYDPITHQAEFTRTISLTEARSNPSFDRFYRKFSDLLVERAAEDA